MTQPKNNSAEAVVEALHALGGNAASAEIRVKTGLGKTTVKDALKALTSAGTVERYGPLTSPRYKLVVETWEWEHPGGGDKPAVNDVSAVLDSMHTARPLPKPEENEVADKEQKRGTCTVCEAAMHKEGRSWLHDEPVQDDHKATSRKQREAAAPQFSTCTECNTSVHKDGRSWVHDQPGQEGHKATVGASRTSQAGTKTKFGKGELEGKLLGYLQDHPEEAFGASALAAHFDAFPGSTAFALDALVRKGNARLTQDKPKKWQAA